MTCSLFGKSENPDYKQNTYWKPKSRNYPAIDAIISLPSGLDWDACALQMTVSHDHGVIRQYVEDNLRKLEISPTQANSKRQLFPFFFVVPADKFEDFPHQKYLTAQGQVVKSSSALVDRCVQQFALEVRLARK
jgi:hypothetical protein